jgi:signal transduction histidine kinase
MNQHPHDNSEKQRQEVEAFSHRVAHDLSGAAQNVKAYAKRAIKKSGDPEAQLKYLDRIIECADISLDIIKGLYQLSGLSRGTLKVEKLPIKDCINSSLIILKDQLESASVGIRVECPHELEFSHDLMLLVFQNLIGNAIKFSSLEKEPEITVRSEQHGQKIHLMIEDNGPGIPEEKRDQVFQAFERLHGDDVPGLGIGLSIVARVLDKHQASIHISTSKELEGTCFTIVMNAVFPGSNEGEHQ